MIAGSPEVLTGRSARTIATEDPFRARRRSPWPTYTRAMATEALSKATLDTAERRTLARFVELLEGGLGEGLISAWLYGSRARGEPPHDESDVDVMLVTAFGDHDADLVDELLWNAAELEGANPMSFSVQVVDLDWIEDRRRIESFFIQEVDRDKLVLAGKP